MPLKHSNVQVTLPKKGWVRYQYFSGTIFIKDDNTVVYDADMTQNPDLERNG